MSNLQDFDIATLTARCWQETERYRRGQSHDERYCFELLRRAIVERDEAAWDAVYQRYHRLVRQWVGSSRVDADERVGQHIARCVHCATEAQAYAKTQRKLRAIMYRASCPESEVLGNFYLNTLPLRERLRVSRHLRRCPHCCRELRRYELSPQEREATPGIWQTLRGAVTEVIEALRLTPNWQPVGVRGGYARQVYQVGGVKIVIEKQPAGYERTKLIGKVKAPREQREAWHGCTVHLFDDEREWAQGTINERGFFFLERVPSGEYAIRLDAAGKEIWLGDISV